MEVEKIGSYSKVSPWLMAHRGARHCSVSNDQADRSTGYHLEWPSMSDCYTIANYTARHITQWTRLIDDFQFKTMSHEGNINRHNLSA